MLPTHHALAASILAVPLARRGWNATDIASFLAAAVIIDSDHFLQYVIETGDFSLVRAYRLHRGRYRHPHRWRFRRHWPHLGFEPGRQFHAAPVLALAVLLALRWPRLWPVTVGLLLHRVQDELWSYFY